MTALLPALAAAVGTYLFWSAVTERARVLGVARGDTRRLQFTTRWLAQAGLAEARRRDVVATVILASVAFALFAYVIFGASVLVLGAAALGAATPVARWRRQRDARLAAARDAWPRMIEEIRVLTGSLGRSVPQALFEVGERVPRELRPAFSAAQREWHLTTDFARTVGLLKKLLADSTADATLETLVVAHELGSSSLDRRLEALADDRRVDVHDRKDARARQAGVRFARRFVIIVPIGMAVVGLQIGDGRDAYRTSSGQLASAIAVAATAGCWLWSSHYLRMPSDRRVFEE